MSATKIITDKKTEKKIQPVKSKFFKISILFFCWRQSENFEKKFLLSQLKN